MKIESVEPELFATVHLFDKGVTTLLERFLIRRAEIDKVTIVREYLTRSEAIFRAATLKKSYTLFGEGRREPLSLVFSKQGKSGCPDIMCIEGSIFHSA